MVGLLRYKTAHKCSLSASFRHSGVGRNPGVVGPVRSYNRAFTYPCQPLSPLSDYLKMSLFLGLTPSGPVSWHSRKLPGPFSDLKCP